MKTLTHSGLCAAFVFASAAAHAQDSNRDHGTGTKDVASAHDAHQRATDTATTRGVDLTTVGVFGDEGAPHDAHAAVCPEVAVAPAKPEISLRKITDLYNLTWSGGQLATVDVTARTTGRGKFTTITVAEFADLDPISAQALSAAITSQTRVPGPAAPPVATPVTAPVGASAPVSRGAEPTFTNTAAAPNGSATVVPNGRP